MPTLALYKLVAKLTTSIFRDNTLDSLHPDSGIVETDIRSNIPTTAIVGQAAQAWTEESVSRGFGC